MTNESVDLETQLTTLQEVLGHRFERPDLLVEALTHPSTGNNGDAGRRDYERLEFLGDRVLGLVVAEMLLALHGTEREGAIARRHTELVRGETLAVVARGIGLGQYIRLSKGEDIAGGRENDTILSDCCEAVIAALYIDGGMPAAERFIQARWTPLLSSESAPPIDPKTELQEWTQHRKLGLPAYRTLSVVGPDHDPTFSVEVSVEGYGPVTGTGRSKQQAEKAAAADLLRQARGKGNG